MLHQRFAARRVNMINAHREFFYVTPLEELNRHIRGTSPSSAPSLDPCLDQCAKGPALLVYPQQVWYTCPMVEDAREISEAHLSLGWVAT